MSARMCGSPNFLATSIISIGVRTQLLFSVQTSFPFLITSGSRKNVDKKLIFGQNDHHADLLVLFILYEQVRQNLIYLKTYIVFFQVVESKYGKNSRL